MKSLKFAICTILTIISTQAFGKNGETKTIDVDANTKIVYMVTDNHVAQMAAKNKRMGWIMLPQDEESKTVSINVAEMVNKRDGMHVVVTETTEKLLYVGKATVKKVFDDEPSKFKQQETIEGNGVEVNKTTAAATVFTCLLQNNCLSSVAFFGILRVPVTVDAKLYLPKVPELQAVSNMKIFQVSLVDGEVSYIFVLQKVKSENTLELESALAKAVFETVVF